MISIFRAMNLGAAILLCLPLMAADLAPTGTLRVAFLGTNPVQGRVDPQTGAVTGPVGDLVRDLAKQLGVPYTFTPVVGAREVMDRLKAHTVDIGFLANDPDRAAEVDFSVPYLLMASAYIVRADSPLQNSASVDRAGMRVSAVKGASQEIFLSSHLKNTRLTPVAEMPTEQELAKQLLGGELDAFAANRSRVMEIAAHEPKLRVLPDNFTAFEQAIVIEKGNPARLAEINRFLSSELTSGVVKQSIERAKLAGVDAAPARH
jgi:polar amino acid transport system substrate-binding protein